MSAGRRPGWSGGKSAEPSRSGNNRGRSGVKSAEPSQPASSLGRNRGPLLEAPVAGRGPPTMAEGGDANYQICARWLSGRTIGSPGLHPKAWANAGMLERGPIVRNFCGA